MFLLFELYGATEKGSAGMNINNHLTASNSNRGTLDYTLHTDQLEYTGGHEVLSFAIKALATALLIVMIIEKMNKGATYDEKIIAYTEIMYVSAS